MRVAYTLMSIICACRMHLLPLRLPLSPRPATLLRELSVQRLAFRNHLVSSEPGYDSDLS